MYNIICRIILAVDYTIRHIISYVNTYFKKITDFFVIPIGMTFQRIVYSDDKVNVLFQHNLMKAALILGMGADNFAFNTQRRCLVQGPLWS